MAQEIPLLYLLLVAFAPPLLFLLYVRSREDHDREPIGGVLRGFLFGGTIGVGLAILLELVLLRSDLSQIGRPYEALQLERLSTQLLLAVIIAPLVEELTKALGLPGLRWRIEEPEDGLVYGASLGLGFAATENLFYEIAALQSGGEGAFYATAAVRSVSSTLLHATASAVVGWGYGLAYLKGRFFRPLWVIPFYLGAVLLHGAFNLAASLENLAGLALAVVGGLGIFRWMVRKIERLDREGRTPKLPAKLSRQE